MNDIKLDTTGLLPPQIPHAMDLLNSLYLNGVSADTSETGCGKTYVAAWIAKQFNAPVVVLCPKSVIPTWKEILGSFGVKPYLVINYEKIVRGNTPWVVYRKPKIDPKTGKEVDELKCHLTTVKFPSNALVICDESHKFCGPYSLTAGVAIALKRQGYSVHTMSATQATDVTGMRAFGFVTNLHDLYGWRKWCLLHGAEEVGEQLHFDKESEEAKKRMLACHENLNIIQGIARRLTREQMRSLFPENQIVAQAFDLGGNSSQIQDVYLEMEREIDELDKNTENYSGHIFAIMVKARRKAEMLKIPLFAEMIEDLYDEGKSPVVFLNYTRSIVALNDRLKNRFGEKIGFIYGGQSDTKRQSNINNFQLDRKRILLCNLKAGGVAISLHDLHGNHPRASLVSPSFSAIDMLQALGRIHRQGGKTTCYQRIIFASGCIEEYACRKVQLKLDNLSCLNDGDLMAGIRFF